MKRPNGHGRSTATPPLEERPSYKVYRVTAKLAHVAGRVFRSLGVDLISARLLIFLMERGELRVGELVELLLQPQSTISEQLGRLEKRKLIRRRRARDDNRAVTVVLTASGRRAAERCDALSTDVYERMTGALTEREARQLDGLLGRLFETLEQYEASRLRRQPGPSRPRH